MENTAIRRGKVEMSVVCSDLSLLENINSLLNDNGFISVEDEQGIMHYIVDGRHNRDEVAVLRSGKRHHRSTNAALTEKPLNRLHGDGYPVLSAIPLCGCYGNLVAPLHNPHIALYRLAEFFEFACVHCLVLSLSLLLLGNLSLASVCIISYFLVSLQGGK